MKKKQAKALRQLAQQLPKSYEIRKHTYGVKGEDITEEQRKNIDFKIEEEKVYHRTGKILNLINHYSRLKSAWNRNKEQGLADYILWLDANNKRVNEELDTQMEMVSEELIEVAKGPMDKFWNNLIAFLYSFFSTFVKK